MKFRPHCPGFVNDGISQRVSQEFFTLSELREIPQVSMFLAKGDQLEKRFRKSDPATRNPEHILMAVAEDGTSYVVGFLSPADEAWEAVDLPIWKPRDIEQSNEIETCDVVRSTEYNLRIFVTDVGDGIVSGYPMSDHGQVADWESVSVSEQSCRIVKKHSPNPLPPLKTIFDDIDEAAENPPPWLR